MMLGVYLNAGHEVLALIFSPNEIEFDIREGFDV